MAPVKSKFKVTRCSSTTKRVTFGSCSRFTGNGAHVKEAPGGKNRYEQSIDKNRYEQSIDKESDTRASIGKAHARQSRLRSVITYHREEAISVVRKEKSEKSKE